LTTGENDVLVLVIGPCATVVIAPPILSADAAAVMIPIVSNDVTPSVAAIALYRIGFSQLDG
jgi:hypothetical protein